jgi:sulfatase modifying factor 1
VDSDEKVFWVAITVFGALFANGLFFVVGSDHVFGGTVSGGLGLVVLIWLIRDRIKQMPVRTPLLIVGASAVSILLGYVPYALYSANANIGKSLAVRGVRLSRMHLNYVWVPPGAFSMGCLPKDDPWCDKHPEETPLHTVAITKGFWIGQTEVTVGAYKRLHVVMPSAPSFNTKWLEEDQPILNVTWDEASAFCAADKGRLPTEAQWEYAARGKSTSPRYGDTDKIAWYSGNSNDKAHAVQQLTPNYLGLYDMLGNAWEWTRDWYDPNYYSKSPSSDPFQDEEGGSENERRSHVLRGGSWHAIEEFNRVSDRNREPNTPSKRDVVGFRCVQEE